MFDHIKIEKKWQDNWEKNKTFKTDVWDFSKPKFYILDMFPYPSGQGLHVGHPAGYTGGDVVSRFKRMQGFNVLHPMGFDAFGLPSEQYAIKTGNHPGPFTIKNISTLERQLKLLGYDYDWDRQISTADPKFYKWTQWIFGELYKDGLAKYVDMPVNWCEELGTVLANDEIIDGLSERGGYPVIKKNLKQWVIDIPVYAERLLEGLETINWPKSTKEMQKNWIGKSIGAEVAFKINGTDLDFKVFTTRADTLFGATYCVLSPEHALVNEITTTDRKDAVDAYIRFAGGKSDMERTELSKDKTGEFTGAYAVNPVNNKLIPIWISDYVLSTYGTGAIMAVPAHDQRDYEFATKFGLEIIKVLDGDISTEAFVGNATHVNSDFINGLDKETAIEKMNSWLEEKNIGKKSINYKMREWIFARQRYWGEPVPIIHMEDDSTKLLSIDELPLELPVLEQYTPKVVGTAPLQNSPEWVNVEVDGLKGKRETTTMPGSAGSSWYFLRYIDPHNETEIGNKELLKHWMPVDFYAGGSEHTTGHLLYSRMWNNYLYDKGISPVKEPFQKLYHQGMILGANGEKMSKSKGNIVNPDDIIKSHGADTLRLFILFMGPLEAAKQWNENGLDGARKFLDRVERIFEMFTFEDSPELDKVYNQTIKKVTEDYENSRFNTAISQMMIFINEVYKVKKISKDYFNGFLKLLNPIAPHVTEELNEILGFGELAYSKWPLCDESKLVESSMELVVQVNGKVRDKINVDVNLTDDEIKAFALTDKVTEITKDLNIVKVIYVKGKLISIVAK